MFSISCRFEKRKKNPEKVFCFRDNGVWTCCVKLCILRPEYILTAEYMYSGRNMQTFRQQVQTPLSLKQKIFSGFFIAFLKSTWNGEHFQKKGESSSLSISEIIDSKRGGYLSAWKALLQNSFR